MEKLPRKEHHSLATWKRIWCSIISYINSLLKHDLKGPLNSDPHNTQTCRTILMKSCVPLGISRPRGQEGDEPPAQVCPADHAFLAKHAQYVNMRQTASLGGLLVAPLCMVDLRYFADVRRSILVCVKVWLRKSCLPLWTPFWWWMLNCPSRSCAGELPFAVETRVGGALQEGVRPPASSWPRPARRPAAV